MAARMRPRLDVVLPRSPADVLAQLRFNLADPQSACEGRVEGRHLQLFIREDQRHTWSPFLEADVAKHPDGAHVTGRIGPHPSVWTFFVLCYAVSAFVAFAALIVGGVQWSLAMPAWGFAVVPACALLAGGTYALALVGQRIGAEQVDELEQFVEAAATDAAFLT
ncbi:MAG: hypothetical protein AAGF99_10545 [Bacteroidota bacterium]